MKIIIKKKDIQINELIGKSFDVLLFTDIGMTTTSILLANHRIAPKQITVGGHPITTGIKTIDLFVVKKTACDNINYLKKNIEKFDIKHDTKDGRVYELNDFKKKVQGLNV